MTNLPPDGRSVFGGQAPRLSSIPEYAQSTGDEAVELARIAGLILDPWQQVVLRHSLGERADGKWAAFQVGLVVPRQNGKDAVLEARELAELFLVSQLAGPRLVLHSAHLFSTSLEHFRRLKARIEDTPDLRRMVKHRGARMIGIRESHGEESIELQDGSRILFAARTRGGRRGFSADLLVWNEAMELPDAVVGAVMPTVSARTGPEFLPGPQVWYTGSAVNQLTMPHGVQLARVRELGIAGDVPDLAYFEWSAEDHADPADPAVWAQANPGLGVRITAEYVASERRAMPSIEFATERLGVGDWPPTSDEAARVITAEMWAPLADPSSKILKGHCFALDVDPGQAWATLAAAGQRDDGLWHIGVVEHGRGVQWVAEACKDWLGRFPGSSLVVDPRADLADLVAELDRLGVQVVRMASGDVKDACGGLYRAIVERGVRFMPPQPELDAAVAAARTKPLLDAWKWDRRSGALITPLVACTNALWGARTQAIPEVHDLNEIWGRLQRRRQGGPAPVEEREPVATGHGQSFVPIDQAPVHRGLFRP